MLTCSENPTLRYSLCLCDQEKDFRKNRSDVVMNKMVELLGEERGPQDIEEVCFGEIKISKFVQSLMYLNLFIYRPVANLAHDVGLYTFVMKISPIA